jgi:hypothetical protein
MRILKSILSRNNGFYGYDQANDFQSTGNSNIHRISSILSQSESHRTSLPVSSTIRSHGIDFGSNPDVVRKKLGKPDAVLHHGTHNVLSSYLFITNFLNNEVKTYFHFFKKELFLVEHVFYVFNQQDNESLFSILNHRFDIRLHSTKTPQQLIDAHGNRLLIQQDVYINLYYISADNDAVKSYMFEHSADRIRELKRIEQISDWMEKI